MAFKPRVKIEHIEAPADVVPYDEGAEPFRASVRVTLTLKEMKEFARCAPDQGTIKWDVLAEILAPYIVSWNADSPPPAEAGPEAFDALSNAAVTWVMVEASSRIRAEKARSSFVPKVTPLPTDKRPGSAAC